MKSSPYMCQYGLQKMSTSTCQDASTLGVNSAVNAMPKLTMNTLSTAK